MNFCQFYNKSMNYIEKLSIDNDLGTIGGNNIKRNNTKEINILLGIFIIITLVIFLVIFVLVHRIACLSYDILNSKCPNQEEDKE